MSDSNLQRIKERQNYVAAVVAKLRLEGKQHISLEQVEQLLKDAFAVEAAADLAAKYYLLSERQAKPLGPMSYSEAYGKANQLAEGDGCDVEILQKFDTYLFLDY